MEALYVFSGICLFIGVVSLFMAWWSRDPKHIGTAIGKLANSKKVMRRVHKYSEKKAPYTTATYLYEVSGKTYRLRHGGGFGRSTLMPRVTVYYLKCLPRFGYLDCYPWGIYTMMGVFYLICAVIILLIPYL